MSPQSPPVVVAVGHDPYDLALAFAVDEAVRAGCGIHLVHAVHVVVQGPEYAMLASDLEKDGRVIVEQARETVLALAGERGKEVPVTTLVRVGAVVPTLVQAAREACMVVLQRRDLSTVARIVTRSVSSGVAARTQVPVVSVPSHWTPARSVGTPTVTVGIDVPQRSGLVLRAAVTQARSRGAVLRVVHGWHFPDGFDEALLTRDELQRWTDRAAEEVTHLVESLGDEADGVELHVEAEHGHPADVLVAASGASDLLVVGRHDPLVPFGSHLGPVARAVLREADCPVLLAEPRPRHSAPGGTTADAGSAAVGAVP